MHARNELSSSYALVASLMGMFLEKIDLLSEMDRCHLVYRDEDGDAISIVDDSSDEITLRFQRIHVTPICHIWTEPK
jgi:hypothetical protein